MSADEGHRAGALGLAPAGRLVDLVEHWARSTPGAPAVTTASGTWTFADLDAAVRRWSTVVAERTAPGDRVAVLSDNHPDVVALMYAVPAAGRTLVPLNTRHAPPEIVDQVGRSGATLLVASDVHLDAVLDDLARVRLTGGPGTRAHDVVEGLRLVPITARPDGAGGGGAPPAWIVFTSGTTGRPKGALLTDASLLAAVRATAAGRPLADDEVYLYPFPLFHVSAYNVLHAHARGRPVVLLARFVASEVVELCRRHRVTAMSLAPTMVRMLLDEIGGRPDPRLAALRTVAYGAAPMPPALLAEASAVLGCGFAQGYGMTELSGNAVFLSPADHATALAGDERLARAAGRAAPGVEVRVVDADDRPLPHGRAGEICVRAAQVCAGYWRDPEATAATVVDGWLHTGDVGVLDADGLLTIVDRAKDVVVTGGENVASREVEDAVAGHPAVGQVAVIGLPDDRWGEAVTAVVVPAAGASEADVEALADTVPALVAGRLAGYKKPRRVIVTDALPVNAGGKVDKRALRERYRP